jgi:hypothetical protein
MDELSKFSGTEVTGIRLLSGMESEMSFEIRCTAKPLLTNITLMGLLA